ncbi:hypothetical protein ACTPEF_24250, partial [Clostridioides difficile]
KLVLLLFLAEQVSKGGLGLTPAESASMLASFLAWTYFSPVIGALRENVVVVPVISKATTKIGKLDIFLYLTILHLFFY